MASEDERLRELYEKGRRDGAVGRWDPPIGLTATLLGPLMGYDVIGQDAYEKGYENGRANPKR